MLFGFGKKKVLGLDIGTSSVKIAELEGSGKQFKLTRFGILSLPPGLVHSGEILDTATVGRTITSVIEAMQSKRTQAVCGMFGTAVVVKKISMPKMEPKLVAEQIRWEAEQYIPFDINEVTLEYQLFKSSTGGESMDVLLVAAKQDYIFRYLETVQIAGLKVSAMDVAGFALANCFEINYGVQPDIIGLLNLGAGSTNFIVLKGTDVIFCRDIPVGGGNHTSDLMSTLNISFEEAESLKMSAARGQEVPGEVSSCLQTTNSHLVEEIRNSFDFYNSTSAGASLSKIYITGGGSLIPGLPNLISQSTGLAFEILDPLRKVAVSSRTLDPAFIAQIRPLCSVAIGLALRKENDS